MNRPKKKGTINIFDLLVAQDNQRLGSNNLDPTTAKAASSASSSTRNAIKKSEAILKPKGFVQPNKVKRLSSLKKRLLCDRIAKFSLTGDDKVRAGDPMHLLRDTKSLRLIGFLDPVEGEEDEEEMQEIIADVKDIVSAFGSVETINIKSVTERCFRDVDVTFVDHSCTFTAAAALDGFIVGGRPLELALVSHEGLVLKRGGYGGGAECHSTRTAGQKDEIAIDGTEKLQSLHFATISGFVYRHTSNSRGESIGFLPDFSIEQQQVVGRAPSGKNDDAVVLLPYYFPPLSHHHAPPPPPGQKHIDNAFCYSVLDIYDILSPEELLFLEQNEREAEDDAGETKVVEMGPVFSTRSAFRTDEDGRAGALPKASQLRVRDEEELRDVLRDVHMLCVPHGPVVCVWLEVVDTSSSSSSLSALASLCGGAGVEGHCKHSDGDDRGLKEGCNISCSCCGIAKDGPVVRLELESAQRATEVSILLAGRVVSGQILSTHFVPPEPQRATWGSFTVCVHGYLTEDDLLDMMDERSDPENIVSMKRDLLSMASSGTATINMTATTSRPVAIPSSPFTGVMRVYLPPSVHVPPSDCSGQSYNPLALLKLQVCVAFADIANAVEAMLVLEGSVVGGSRLRARVRSSSRSEETMRQIIQQPQTQLGDSSVRADEVLAPAGAECVAISSARGPVDATPTSSSIVTTRRISGSKYEAAKALPKLAKHTSSPSSGATLPTAHTTSGGSAFGDMMVKPPAIYPAPPTASADVEETVKKFLSSLAGFQQRALEMDPVKAKQKTRLVVGLKQVLNGVKVGRAKIVFLSPDTEMCDALDDRVAQVVRECGLREIPVLYCLSRRKMGKAIGKSTKQSAVAVYDPSGVYEEFKSIVKFVTAAAAAAEEELRTMK